MPKPNHYHPLDPQTAQAYDSAFSAGKKENCNFARSPSSRVSFRRIPVFTTSVDEVGRKAKDRGLTPEILAPMLGVVQNA